MHRKTITKRWLINNLGVVLLILLVIELGFIYALQNYYYSSAKQYLVSKMNEVTGVLSRYSDDSSANFSTEIRNTLENFSDKDKMSSWRSTPGARGADLVRLLAGQHDVHAGLRHGDERQRKLLRL